MKGIFTLLNTLLLTASVIMPQQASAQAPEKMSYQAVIRNSSGALVTNTQIGMEINIRQGSPTGTIVYTETQIPTTNTNGLVSIEIGGGTGFSTINWGSDTYYIETKTALVAPLTTYTITGVSQLLSVPYALNAKTAESISGIIAETDPIYSGSQAANITADDITKLAGIASGAEVNVNADWNAITGDAEILNKPTIPLPADGSETKVSAGTNINVTGTGTTGSPYVVNATGAAHYIGELYGGGVIFWADQTGNHGLICSMIDNSTGIIWTNPAYNNTTVPAPGALSDWNGQSNTTAIVTQAGAGITYAAGLCDAYINADYGTGIFSDWYLPSRGELILLWNSLYQVQKALESDGNAATTAIAINYYWSSSEFSLSQAWGFYFQVGYTGGAFKSNLSYVRAIRYF